VVGGRKVKVDEMVRTLFYFLKVSILGFFISGCALTAQADDSLATDKINIVATTGMVADLVRNIGGERVEVTGLMGPGIDPHLYKASEGDVTRISNADIIFYNGLFLEAQMGRVFENIRDRIPTVAVAEHIDRSLLLTPEEFDGEYDPHVWFDVTLWMQAGVAVREALVDLDPENAEFYLENLERYLSELEELHQYVQEQALRVPLEKRVIITAHDAFNYFGRAYGFEVRGLQGISTAAEASTADVNELAAFIADRRIPAIFIETSVPTRTIEAVQAAVHSRGFDVKIGGELFSDSLGSQGTPEETYIGVVRHNIDTIVNSLLEAENG
jgi:manganese/zinc/iron transport system substrate-binding protein